MSKAMIKSFFPSSYEWVQQKTYWSNYYLLDEILFPNNIAEICPEVQIQIPIISISTTTLSLNVRLPFLAIAAILGIIIGFYCSYKYYYYYYNNYNGLTKNNNNYDHNINFYLCISFLSFGIMNISGLFIHCLWDAPLSSNSSSSSNSYPDLYPFCWICDTYMTGVSSICLLFASIEYIFRVIIVKYNTNTTNTTNNNTTSKSINQQQQQQQQNQQHQNTMTKTTTTTTSMMSSYYLYIGWMICQLIGIGCIMCFFRFGVTNQNQKQTTTTTTAIVVSSASSSHPLELWYLVPIILTGIPITIAIFGETCIKSSTSITMVANNNTNGNENNDNYATFQRLLLLLPTIIQDIFQSMSCGQWLLIIGSIIAILGVVLDKYWCLLLRGFIIQDLFTASTLLFFGCDIMFIGIYLSSSSSFGRRPIILVGNNDNNNNDDNDDDDDDDNDNNNKAKIS